MYAAEIENIIEAETDNNAKGLFRNVDQNRNEMNKTTTRAATTK